MTKVKNSTDKIKPGKASYAGRYLLSAIAQDEKALEEITKLVEKHSGKVLRSECLGKKTLAYPINKFKELFLISVFFEMEIEDIKKIESVLKHEEAVERFLLTKWLAEVPTMPGERPERTSRARMERE